MTSEHQSLTRVFEVDNARNLNRDEVVSTFVSNNAFWRLLSAKNHVVYGSRGSGKTVIAKMLSHSHLSRFMDPMAQETIASKRFLGVYVPTRLSWLGSQALRRTTHSDTEIDVFLWRLNLATCIAFIDTLESYLETYNPEIEGRLKKELAICDELSFTWFGKEKCRTTHQLRDAMADLDHEKKNQWTARRVRGKLSPDDCPAGLYFHNDLFDPLRRSIELAQRILGFGEGTVWLLCLDEVEFLSEEHHRIINTYMREHSGNLFFKLTTMPYRHYTLDTNIEIPLNEGHDFEYIYLDRFQTHFDRADGDKLPSFASSIFRKRLEAVGLPHKTLRKLFGPSKLLDSEREEWSITSPNYQLLEKYCNKETVERAGRLIETDLKRFRDQIGRKVQGALLLKHQVAMTRGRAELQVYSGASLIARCSDGNPRALITLINALLFSGTFKRQAIEPMSLKPIPATVQNRVLMEFSGRALRRIQGEETGPALFRLIERIGHFMETALHERPIGTDFVSSIKFDLTKDKELSLLVKAAVGLGYLYPSVNPKDPDRLPVREGTFHLAFMLAPHFHLLPRKGVPRNLSSILTSSNAAPGNPGEQQTFL